MDRKVLKNSKWKHFKGNEYIVLDIAKHTETKESMVIYYRENDENQKMFARPVDSFLGLVNSNKYPNSKQKHRFELVKRNIHKKFMIYFYNVNKDEYTSNYLPPLMKELNVIDIAFKIIVDEPIDGDIHDVIKKGPKYFNIKKIEVIEPYENKHIGTDISLTDIMIAIQKTMAGYDILLSTVGIQFSKKKLKAGEGV